MPPELYNRTRRSASIPRALARRGQVYAIPLYYLLRLSDLGREGFDHSGSYRFADHIYSNEPSGRGLLGRWIDARLLAMPAVRAFRSRYLASRDTLASFLSERRSRDRETAILSVPCGIPRELVEGLKCVRNHGGNLDGVRLHGLDLDPDVLSEASRFVVQNGLGDLVTHHGDALDRATYPSRVAFLTCTGLGEFLDDDRLQELYRIFHAVLEPGGMLVTSGMARRPIADWLLQLAEIRVHYRGAADLSAAVRRAGFARVETRSDETGIQTLLVAWR